MEAIQHLAARFEVGFVNGLLQRLADKRHAFECNALANGMRHLCNVCLHVVGQSIHARGSCYRWRKAHGKFRVCKHDLCKQLRREEYLLLMRCIVGNDGAAAHLAAGAGCCWYGNEMRDVVGHVYITADKVVVFKKGLHDG